MSLETITEKIITEAETVSRSLEKEAERKIKRIESDLEKERTRIRETFQQNLEALKKQNEDRVRAGAEAEVKKAIEKTRRQSLDQIFVAAKEELCRLDPTTYSQLLQKLLKTVSSEEAKQAEATVPSNRQTESDQASGALGLSFRSVKTDPELDGGLIIKGDNFHYDLSFSNLIKSVQNKEEIAVAQILFRS